MKVPIIDWLERLSDHFWLWHLFWFVTVIPTMLLIIWLAR